MNDLEAIQRCRSGEPDCFRQLVERYQAEAMGHALAILGNREDAADATQTAFIRAFGALRGFDTARRFYPWFYMILRNCCYRLAARRPPANSGAAEPLLELAEAASEPGQEEELQRLEAALAQLEPVDRELITLKHLDRLTYDELSTRLGIPPGTVMSRLYHARQRLRARMQAMEAKHDAA